MTKVQEELRAKHTFTYPSLAPGAGSSEQPYVRFLMFIKKRPDISYERFDEWWKTIHADLAVSVAGFGGYCKRYVQLHQKPEHQEELKKYGMEPLPYDGIGEMYVKSLEDWIEFSSSPAFAKKLVHDGANFMDGTMKVMLGSDNLILGSSIPDCGGRDGVLASDSKLTSKL